jgi:hypothetical protein
MGLSLELDVLLAIVAKPRDVDVNKYEEYLKGTFEQLLDTLNMSFDALVNPTDETPGKRKSAPMFTVRICL